jgi:hypothetical protein
LSVECCALNVHQKIFPGFKMPLGSKDFLMRSGRFCRTLNVQR